MVTTIPVNSCLRTPFDSKRVQGSETLLEPALQHFYPNFPSIQDKLSCKSSFSVRSEILELFRNTLTGDHMYSRRRWEKFPQKVQTLLSQKWKKLSEIFIAFLEYTQNFPHFEKKYQLHNLNILEVINPEKCGYFNARKLLF